MNAELYTTLGFALVPIPHGAKAPQDRGWSHRTVTTQDEAARRFAGRLNIGVEHGSSNTGALDLDSPEDAALALATVGLDLDEILRHPTLRVRGKNASKPLYDLQGLELPYRRLSWPHRTERLSNGNPKHYTILELRSGSGKQDLLPPSLHPSGLHYTWEPHPPRTRADLLPPPPSLLELWRDPALFEQLRRACPWAEALAPPPRRRTPARTPSEGGSVIVAWNAKHDLHDLLTRYGYKRRGRKRYLPPESTTRIAGAYIYEDEHGQERVVVYNASSPLCHQDTQGRTLGVDVFGVWLEYEHGGDLTAAVRAAANDLGMAFVDKAVSTFLSPWASGKPDSWTRTPTHWGRPTGKSPWS